MENDRDIVDEWPREEPEAIERRDDEALSLTTPAKFWLRLWRMLTLPIRYVLFGRVVF